MRMGKVLGLIAVVLTLGCAPKGLPVLPIDPKDDELSPAALAMIESIVPKVREASKAVCQARRQYPEAFHRLWESMPMDTRIFYRRLLDFENCP